MIEEDDSERAIVRSTSLEFDRPPLPLGKMSPIEGLHDPHSVYLLHLDLQGVERVWCEQRTPPLTSHITRVHVTARLDPDCIVR